MDQRDRPKPNHAPKPGPKLVKRPSFVRRVAVSLTALAVVLCAVAAIAFRDRLSLSVIQRWLTYQTLVLSDSGHAERFFHGGSVNDSFTLLDNDLLVCSPNSLSLYSGSGTCYVSQSVQLSTPVVDSNGTLAVVYDAGGSELYVVGERELIYSTRSDDPILSAHLNRNGQLTVVTQPSSYRGSVTVYSSAYEKLVQVNLSSAFVMDAALSDDGSTLAILTIGQQEGSFCSLLTYYTVDASSGDRLYTPQHTVNLGRSVVLGLRHRAEQLWALGDLGLSLVNHAGELSALDWSDQYLKLYDLGGEGFALALLGTYRAGSQATLLAVDSAGQTSALPVNEQILSLSASGRRFAVLTADRLDIYRSDMTLLHSVPNSSGARTALLMQNGGAMLISADSALYVSPP